MWGGTRGVEVSGSTADRAPHAQLPGDHPSSARLQGGGWGALRPNAGPPWQRLRMSANAMTDWDAGVAAAARRCATAMGPPGWTRESGGLPGLGPAQRHDHLPCGAPPVWPTAEPSRRRVCTESISRSRGCFYCTQACPGKVGGCQLHLKGHGPGGCRSAVELYAGSTCQCAWSRAWGAFGADLC